jgi:ceramide glucosyltransferase
VAEALALACLAVSAAGCVYLLYAAAVSARFAVEAAAKPALPPPVTLLKPLNCDEPALLRNLATFCAQVYPAPTQLVFGVQSANDKAIAVVDRLKADFPSRDIELVVDPTEHGANLKIANLINMMPKVAHACVVLSDSDISAPKDYLLRVTAALAEPGVGCVTCLYHGIAETGFWSRLSALGINAHYLPNALVGLKSGLATPCFGSTIALRRDHLDAIGGFAAFSDFLADDYAIGAAIREKGLTVAIPRFLVGHSCTEASLTELWRHELRWARTIRSLDPWGHAGSVFTHPLAFALLAAAAGKHLSGVVLALLAVAGRTVLLRVIERTHGLAATPYWLVPLRDLFSCAVFVWSLLGRGVTWRGRRYRMRPDGVMSPD